MKDKNYNNKYQNNNKISFLNYLRFPFNEQLPTDDLVAGNTRRLSPSPETDLACEIFAFCP